MKPTVGRQVHYRISEDVVRPATIVSVVEGDTHGVNLQVFFDGGNDRPESIPEIQCVTPTVAERATGLGWRASVAEGTGVGQWSWPPRA